MYNRNKRKFYRLIIILLILFIPFISIGYSALQTVLNINGKIAINEFNATKLFDKVYYDSCNTTYTGEVTDSVGITTQATNVKFAKCSGRRNVIFNNMCWQVIRTTETGGTKIIYNGRPVNGKCESTRSNQTGFVGNIGEVQELNSNYLYGSSFTYDTTNNTFILINTSLATWSDSTYESLLGKYTCKNTTGTCTTLYNVNSYFSNTSAIVVSYTIGSTNYSSIGTSPFNANNRSPAMVGYMFNNVETIHSIVPGTTPYLYGSSFTYSNGTYTLSGTTKTISNWSTGYTQLDNTHYTCWNTTGTCQKLSYIYYINIDEASYYYLSDGKDISDLLNDMLFDNNVNKYNSSVKGIIDAWYRENFSTKTSLLEDAVYCNARNITYYGGYNPNGGPLTTDYLLQFKNHQTSTNLACSNLTDQFSTSNNKAKLTYPVSLLEAEEAHNVNSATLMGTGANYWRLSPAYAVSYSRVRYLTYEGSSQVDIVDNLYDVRPVISLANDVEVLEGKGSETNPWIIDDVVFPTQIKNIIDNESCIEEYEGQVTDKVGVTETAKHIYFNKCSNKRNIIFNNMCWQMIRTTETGGIKMIYNGIPENGKCESTRSNQTGFVGTTGEIQQINSNYLYGSSFTYDITNNTFTLTDTNLATWSDSTYENLIGKYTCKNITGTCTTLYNVNGYSTNNSAIITSYTIGSTNYASIGTSPFNANNRLHSMVGYMFNKAFPINTTQPGTTSYKYGNSFTYSNGTYTLSGTTKNISNWSTGYTQLDNTHYTCWNTTGTCSTISYIYFVNETNASYINITDGKNVNDILNDMLNNDNVNRYNSSAKGIIDAWYRENLSIKTNMLEDAVYCNARNITNYGGWDPNGPLATNYSLQFKNYSGATDLSCQNITDQFAVSNNKAKLAYPTSLLEAEEAHNINNGSLMSIGANYWRLSPGYSVTYARVRYLTSEGSSVTDTVDKPFNIRPVVSLKEGTTFTGGDGSTTNPWTVYEGEKLYDTLINLSQEENSCINKYAGNVTDRLGITETANHVYFDNCENKRNIIFGGFCWQVIRTTETGGTKLIYNGEPVNGKCESTRTDHKGIVGANGTTQTLNAEYLYGDSFIYDITTNTFTLTDTTTATWSDSTYENLLGKFTCKNTVGTCTTLYNVNGYSNNTTAYTSAYTISDTNYAQIGTSAFNAYYRSPAMVGYMFNKVYEYAGNRAPTTGSLMGNDVSYANGTYTLLPASGESELGTTKDATHHYTCNTTSSTCTKVRYYYYSSGSSYNYYIELDGEANIEEVINNMLYNDNVNRYNSSIKGIIDAWYSQNLISKTNMLEDTVYCNARNMANQSTNGWNKDGSLSTYIHFKNLSSNNDISCINETDQFALSNNKAKLTYPVSLINNEEWYNIGTSSLRKTGADYWGLSPSDFARYDAYIRSVRANDNLYSYLSNYSYGSRPAISLKNGVTISSGDGSETDPWIIGE